MKKTIRIVALCLILVMAVTALASCKPSGTYEAFIAESGIRLTFKGNDVTIAYVAVGIEIASNDATFEIEDDKIIFSVPDDSKITNPYIKAIISTPLPYEEIDAGIKIAGVTYVKADK